jgi:putative SOS response-associated peptidase YedK
VAPAADGVEPLRTCTIVTTAANPAVARLHDRMPVILDRGAEAAWLDHAHARRRAAGPACGRCPRARRAAEVGSAVNDAHHDAEDCLDPPDPADAPPATLF